MFDGPPGAFSSFNYPPTVAYGKKILEWFCSELVKPVSQPSIVSTKVELNM